MNHIYPMRLVVLKRPGFQSQKYGMPKITPLMGALFMYFFKKFRV